MTNSIRLHPIDKAPTTVPAFEAYVPMTGAALLIVLAIAIYLAALSPGNWPNDIALMAAFP